jgi:ribonuclease BN (tRNA processing enzyme)
VLVERLMRLTVVGCAPAYTSRSGRASSCYLVEEADTAIALDMGQGSFSELWRYRSPGTLAAVIISHLHADHCVDLVALRHWVRYENGGRGPALYGPRELRARFDAFQGQADFLADLAGGPLEPGPLRIGSLLVEARHVTHIADSFAFRVSVADSDGPAVVYSGDCAVADDLLALVRPGDTLLCEAGLGASLESGIHLTAAQAAGVAQRGGAARLILTHVLDRNAGPDLIPAAAGFGGELLVAEPGWRSAPAEPD